MTWLLRCGFVLLIILTLVWKLAAPPAIQHPGDAANTVAAVLKGHLAGPVSRRPWGGPKDSASIITAPVVGCSAPLIIAPRTPPSFAAVRAFQQLQPPGSHLLFAYLDWVSDRPDRWALLRWRIWEKAQAIIGLSQYTSSATMLIIAEPAGCAAARTIRWRRFWAPNRGDAA